MNVGSGEQVVTLQELGQSLSANNKNNNKFFKFDFGDASSLRCAPFITMMRHFAQSLCGNTTIEILEFVFRDNTNGALFLPFIRAMGTMPKLKFIKVRGGFRSIKKETFDEWRTIISEQDLFHRGIQTIHFEWESNGHGDLEEANKSFCLLRATTFWLSCKGLLRCDTLPEGIWPHVLCAAWKIARGHGGKINIPLNALFRLLQELPRLAIRIEPSQASATGTSSQHRGLSWLPQEIETLTPL